MNLKSFLIVINVGVKTVTIRTLYRVPSRSRVVIELFPGTWVTVAGATFPVPGTRVRTRAMYSYQRRCDQIKGRQLLLP